MKIWTIKKRSLWVGGVIAALVFGLLWTGQHASRAVSKTQRDLPIYCVDKGEEKVVSISFDAAWGNEDTGQLIEIMEKYGVRATFFVVGGWVDRYPQSVKELADAGHEVMNHSDTHPHMTQISKEKMKEEVQRCSDKIEKVTGKRPHLLRAPYGDYNNDVIQSVRESGCYTIQWDVDSLDWKDLSADEITKRVTEKVKPGSIVLFHNAAKHTPEALPVIIEKLQKDGYRFVPISELIYTDRYTIDQTGCQHPVSGDPSDEEKGEIDESKQSGEMKKAE